MKREGQVWQFSFAGHRLVYVITSSAVWSGDVWDHEVALLDSHGEAFPAEKSVREARLMSSNWERLA